jgi:hypothetical protein
MQRITVLPAFRLEAASDIPPVGKALEWALLVDGLIVLGRVP